MGLITGFIARKAAKKAKKEAAKFVYEHKEEIVDTASNLAKSAVNAGKDFVKKRKESASSKTIEIEAAGNTQKEAKATETMTGAAEFRAERINPGIEAFNEETESKKNKKNKHTSDKSRETVEPEKMSIRELIAEIDLLESEWNDRSYNEKLIRAIDKLIGRYQVPKDKDSFTEMTEIICSSFPTFMSSTKESFKEKFDTIKQKSKAYFKGDEEVRKAVGELKRVLFKDVVARRIWLAIAFAIMIVTPIAILVPLNVIDNNTIPDPPSSSHTIYVEDSYSYFEGKNYQVVTDYFVNKGFLYVTATPLHDLITGWINDEYTVKTVLINNNDRFERKTWYRPEDPVVIKYHSF